MPMPVIFKIFIFWLLQQGSGVVSNSASTDHSATGEQTTVVIPKSIVLDLQGDYYLMQEIISICTMEEPRCEIKQFSNETSVVFAQLKNSARERIMNRVKTFQGRLNFQWSEQWNEL